MTVHVSQPSGNASPLAILKIATTAWRERGGSTDVLRELTALYTTKGTIIPAENVPKYLADLQAHPFAKIIGFKLPPESQAFLDADASADDALLTVAEDAPDTAPQEPLRSELHKAALEYVAEGRKLIPIVPGAKTPMRKKWSENKITTPEEVDAHWSQYPDSNIAFEPEDEGIAIIEQDPGGDVAPLNLPETYEVQSPRGGVHYYFLGTSPPTVQKLGPKIDTRGKGSYVLIPPSVVSGKTYRINANRPMAALPAEIEARLAAKVDARTSDIHELDLPSNIERARSRIADLIEREDVAIQGKGGDTRTFKLACELVRDLGLSVDAAMEAIVPWNAACVPPWDEAELRAKLEHAAAYGQNEPGAYGTKRASETFEGYESKAADIPNEADPAPQPNAKRRRLAWSNYPAARFRPAPLYFDPGKQFIRDAGGAVMIVSAAKGAHKTGVSLTNTISWSWKQKIKTAYFGGEGPQSIEQQRIPAICDHFGITPDDLYAEGNWRFAGEVPKLLDDESLKDAIDLLDPFKPDIIVIDTTARALPGKRKNDDDVMTAACDRAEVLRQRYKCLIILIAHEGKDPTKGTKGASDFEQWVDLVLSLKKEGNLVRATLRHNRMGPDGFSVFYKIIEYSKEACVRVPVLVPFDGPEPDPVEFDARGIDPQLIAFRHLVATILRDWGAHDLSVRVVTKMLAEELVRRKSSELFPDCDPQKGPDPQEWNQAIKNMTKTLDHYTRKRGKKNPLLHGYWEMALPLGAEADANEQRYWFIPRPLHEEEDAEED